MTVSKIEPLDLEDVRSLNALLARVPQGEGARTLAATLGIWSSEAHVSTNDRRTRSYPADYAVLGDQELSKKFGFWNSELARTYELSGLIEGLRKLVEVQAKQHRAKARANARRRIDQENKEGAAADPPRKPVKPTISELNDIAEEDEQVQQADQTLIMLTIVGAQISAFREACATTTNGLSREISLRQAQYSARIRA